MDLVKWAEKEIKLACEKEERAAKETGDPDGADYGILCYMSALKAFKSLVEDSHSGFSIGLTIDILNKLVNCEPLTPIFGTDDEWDMTRIETNVDGAVVYQCNRMFSLFKYVKPDGSVAYSDNNRVVCYDLGDEKGIPYHSGLATRIINKMFPITMPYTGGPKYEVYCRYYLTDEKYGDFDTVYIPGAENRDTGEHIVIGKFYKEVEGHRWVEIDKDEFDERCEKHLKRVMDNANTSNL